MKNEKIIANIERYVATLDSEKQQMFKKSLEQAENERKAVKKLFAAECAPLLELAEIVQELKAEMKEAELKAAGGASLVKRTKLLNKLLSKCIRENFQKAFFDEVYGVKMQCCIIDGYYGFMFKDALDLPMHDAPPVTMQRILPDLRKLENCDFDLAEIKTALKIFKAKKDKTERFCIIEVNGKYYDAEKFITVVEGLGGSVKLRQDANICKADIFESENGLAILCPVRAPENK